VVAGSPDITYDYYYNEGWQVLEVRKGGDGDPLEQYVWGIQYVDAPVVRFRDGNVDGDLLDTQDNTDSTLYYTYDGNFNVTAVIKPDGTVAERYTYDPYGQVTFKAADWSDAASQAKSAYDNEILYCGYRWDPESGLYHVRRRPYHPTLGRWLAPDPIVYGDGMNRSQYVGGNPAVAMDPYGQARVTFRTATGWYEDEKLFNSPGQARACYRVTGSCTEDYTKVKENKCWRRDLEVEVVFVVTLNLKYNRKHNTVSGIIGHERMHTARYAEHLFAALTNAEMDPEEGVGEGELALQGDPAWYKSEPLCTGALQRLYDVIGSRDWYVPIIRNAVGITDIGTTTSGRHANARGDDDENAGYPVSGTEYELRPYRGESEADFQASSGSFQDAFPAKSSGGWSGWVCTPPYKGRDW
jgi:RHS repeat-associated protein